MSMLLKEIERIEALAENKRDQVKLANFWKMYALELRDQAQAEKTELVRQCIEIAVGHAYDEHEAHEARLAIEALLPKE